MKKKIIHLLSAAVLSVVMLTSNISASEILDGIVDSVGNFLIDASKLAGLLYGHVPDEEFSLLTEVISQTDDSLLDSLIFWKAEELDSEDITKYIFVGDRRVQGLKDVSTSKKDIFITNSYGNYSWMHNEAFDQIDAEVEENAAIILWLGGNDIENVNKYITAVNEKADEWYEAGAYIYFANQPPALTEALTTDKEIRAFNHRLQTYLDNIGYLNIYKCVTGNDISTADGLDYERRVYERIYSYLKNTIGSSADLVSNNGNLIWWSSYAQSDVYNRLTVTNWNTFENLRINLFIEPSISAKLSEDILAIEAELEETAEKYGFAPYKELFKALAEYRHVPGDDDIFQMKDSKRNPNPGETLTFSKSLELAGELFRDCLVSAGYPTPLETEGLKVVLQSFEFEDDSFCEFCDGVYTINKAQEYAAIMSGGNVRLDATEVNLYGLYDYKDQKFPDKVLRYYVVISVGNTQLSSNEQQLLTECMAGWSSELEEDRKKVIQKGISLYGSVSYSMDYRLTPSQSSPQYLDCSSFVGWSFYYSGFKNVLASWCTGDFLEHFNQINKSQLHPGDVGLKNYVGGGGENHIGIYLGHSASGEDVWLHCSSSAGSIVIDKYRGFNIYFRYPGFI